MGRLKRMIIAAAHSKSKIVGLRIISMKRPTVSATGVNNMIRSFSWDGTTTRRRPPETNGKWRGRTPPGATAADIARHPAARSASDSRQFGT
jgi:hypothetical protein